MVFIMVNPAFRLALSVLTISLISCSSTDRDQNVSSDEQVKIQGTAGGIRESESLLNGFTSIWFSESEDFFVAGLHKDQSPEPPQTGLMFGSVRDESKRQTHWFSGGAPSGEDLVGIRVFLDSKNQKRVYFLSQLQNAGFFFPNHQYFNLSTWMTTVIHSKIPCEQIEDIDFKASSLLMRCRPPLVESGIEEDFPVANKKSKKVSSKLKNEDSIAQDDEQVDLRELSFDTDPSESILKPIADSQSRDWLNGVLRACFDIGKHAQKKHSRICYKE